MCLKRERPETGDFVIKKYLVLVKISLFQEITKKQFLADTLTKKFFSEALT